MAYIGSQNESGAYIKLDDISSQFDGIKKTFNLTVGGSAFYSQNPYSLLVSLDGTIQEPVTSYIIVENQLTFAEAPSSVSTCYFVVLSTTQTTPALTSLTIGRRDGSAYTMDLHGANLAVIKRYGTKQQVPFNVA